MERMHFHKIPVYVWTVNKKRTMKRYLRMGVDGLITDKPDAALFVRKELIKQRKPMRRTLEK